jgi:hypothetical protein
MVARLDVGLECDVDLLCDSRIRKAGEFELPLDALGEAL